MKLSLIGVSLLAASRALAFDADTIGFYPFEGTTPGASAVGGTVVNKVQADRFAGSVSLTSGATNPFAVFDADAPGKYVYVGNGGEPLCENPRSVSVGSDATASGAGGSLTIEGIGTELSKHHATGNTVEYFFKMASTTEKRWTKNEASVLIYGGYIGTAGTSQPQPLKVYAPNGDSWSESLVSVGDKGSSATNPYRRDFDFSGVGDGKWHHVAIVETADNEVYVYYDYKLVNKNSAPLTMAGVAELTESKPFVFFNHKRQGKVSCLRFTTRALGTDEFMVASDTPSADAGRDAFAFYPFEGATAGASAVGNTVVNKVRGDVFDGSVELTSGASNPFAVFDEDAPGKYIYAGNGRVPLSENPRSVSVGSDATASGAGGKLTIANVGTEISRHHATGNTVEYFFKMASSSERRYSAGGSSVYVYGGFLNASGTAQPLRLYAPISSGSWSEGVISVGAKDDNVYRASVAFSGVNAGWHHVAIVEKTNQTVEVYYDYKLAMSSALKMNGVTKLTEALPFIFFNNNLQGKVSCLRFTSRALESAEFLRAYARKIDAISQPDVAAFYTFKDGVKGASAVGVTLLNDVDTTVPGSASVANSSATAVFDDDAPGTAIYGGEDYPETPFATNPQSIVLDSPATGSSGKIAFPGMSKVFYGAHGTGFTFECFFKFLDGDVAQYDPVHQLNAGYTCNSALSPFCLFLPYVSSGLDYRYGFNYDGKKKATTLPNVLWDGKWHHLAYVETPVADQQDPSVTNLSVVTWIDYRPAGDPYVIPGLVAPGTSLGDVGLELCRNKQHAKFSCVKVTTRPLRRKEFMRTSPRYHGLTIFVR